MKDSADWRDKYLASLDRIEAERTSWRQVDDVLRRLVRRLCIGARGINARLDVELARVTSAMRTDADAPDIEALLTDLTAAVAALDQIRSPSESPAAPAAPAAPTAPAAPAAPRREAPSPPPTASTPAAGPASAPATAPTAAPAGDRAGGQAGVPAELPPVSALAALSEPLILIVERLGLTGDERSDIVVVRDALARPVSALAFENALWQLGELVSAERSRLEREKTEVERVLAQVTSRLEEIATFLSSAESDYGEADRSGRELNERVLGEVKEIGTSVQGATHLGELQRTVKQRLEAINAHLHHFREREEKRARVYRERAERMRARVVQLERETATLEKSLLREQRLALFDSLTGIANRLAYDERVAQEFKRWKRFRQPMSLIAWDLDRFKLINDTFGHKAGDKVLRVVAQLLRDRIRETDFVARYGGEEFAMILVGTNGGDALVVAETVREEIGRLGFHFRGTPVGVTASCGLTEIRESDTPDALFERADQALYRAKEGGRNRCATG